ncbi:hypothetical protein DFH07DRAFT_753828 [Mycena maculata]|uniref:Novel STAND NTPase 1 domain-containing protein n=1 Tax=Mycena maculata TaxID=230809 RepID=A0AAD7I5H5_9AGAR|nr:hypothetical protein DFH07DRAFT_753828 [Mycena maculata]
MVSGGKELAVTLEKLADVIPVPFLSEFVKVAIKVLEACEDVITIEENVKDLQKRIYSLTLTIIANVPVGGGTSEELQGRIKDLHFTLDSIINDLDKIKEQKKYLLIFFHDLNKAAVDKCVSRVNTALEQFTVSHQIHVEERVDEILRKYSNMTTQLDRIEAAVNNTHQPHNAPETLRRQDMPPKHRIFYGRQPFVNNIASLLAHEDTSRVCITGPGGIGKTSVALAVMESSIIHDIFPKKYQFWVPCIEAKSADLLRRILYTQLRITADSYDTLDTLVNELNTSKERRVLLLDNFETPWLSGHDQDKVSDVLSHLARLPHVALMATMTSAFPPSEDIEWQHLELPSLDPAAAHDTFKTIYPGAADGPKLNELLHAIDHVPLAITLMASNGKRSKASPEYLLNEWGKSGIEMISWGPSQSMDRTIGMSVRRDIMTANPEASTLLAILSMLPAGTTGNNLARWTPTLTSHSAAIDTLRTVALIEQEDGDLATSRIFVRPTIQSYMSRHDRISDEVRQQVHDACYEFVLDHKSIPDDAKFRDDLVALASEATNIQGLLMQINVQSLRPNALCALVAFGLYQLSTKPSTVVALHALEVARATKNHRHVAEAHQCLGKIFLKLDRYEEACQHFEEARHCFKNLPSGSDGLRAGECSMELADTWMYMGNKCSKEIYPLVLEAQATLSHNRSDKYHVAHGFLGLGRFYFWSVAHKRDETLKTLSAAKVIFEELDCLASTSECLYFMARTYAQHNEYTEALLMAKEALAKAERTGDGELICRNLINTAKYLIVLSSYDEAFGIIEQSLSMNQAVGRPLAIAQNLELLGYNCAAKMDFPAAQVAYEEARVQYANVGFTWLEEERRCSGNLKKLDSMKDIDQTGLSKLAKPDLS